VIYYRFGLSPIPFFLVPVASIYDFTIVLLHCHSLYLLLATSFIMTELNVIVFGEGGVGKSCLVIRFMAQRFVLDYDPNIEDSYRKQVTVDGEPTLFDILDTAGQDDWYPMTDQWIRTGEAFLILFDICHRDSLDNYVPDLITRIERVKDQDIADIPCLLVATKMDKNEEREVATEEAIKCAHDLKLSGYVETSSLTGTNVEECFHALARIARHGRGHDEITRLERRLQSHTKFSPFNIFKRYQWDKELKKLKSLKQTENKPKRCPIEIEDELPPLDLIPSSFFTDIERLYNEPELADVILKIGSTSIYAHRIILSLRSDAFHKLFLKPNDPSASSDSSQILTVTLPDALLPGSSSPLPASVSSSLSDSENLTDIIPRMIKFCYTASLDLTTPASSDATGKLAFLQSLSDWNQHVFKIETLSSVVSKTLSAPTSPTPPFIPSSLRDSSTLCSSSAIQQQI